METVCRGTVFTKQANPSARLLLTGRQQLLGDRDAVHQQQTAWALASGFH